MTTTMTKPPRKRPWFDEHPMTDDTVHEIRGRLREAREKFEPRPVSLRRFATRLAEKRYPVDWHTVQKYEGYEGTKLQIPVDYAVAVALVTGAPPEWLLLGRGAPPWEGLR